MKVTRTPQRQGGFTLIEMIGVLAIIAILTALLIPKIFAVINESKISSTLMSYNSIKSAAAAHYGKWGKFAASDGAALVFAANGVAEDWDQELLEGDYIEQRFGVKIGSGAVGFTAVPSGSRLRVITVAGITVTTDVTAGDTGAYNIDGQNKNDVTGSYLVEAVIPGVSIEDAKDLNERIDGTILALVPGSFVGPDGLPGTGDDQAYDQDFTGRVKWESATRDGAGLVNGVGPTTTVYMYIAHR